MPFSLPVTGQRHLGKKTATAGTAYVQFYEPLSTNWFTALTFLQFTVGATAHTAYIMRVKSSQVVNGVPCSGTLTAAALASQAVININQDPGIFSVYPGNPWSTADRGIAANDYLAYQCPDKTWRLDTVASVATLAITMTTNIPTGGLPKGAPFWYFGLNTDTNPYDAQAQPIFDLTASSTVNIGSEMGPAFFSSFKRGEPLMLYNANLTNASILERSTVVYADRGSPYQ